MPELNDVLERCTADDAEAWSLLRGAVHRVAGRALRPFVSLSRDDRIDIEAATMTRLVEAVRRGDIRGRSDGEIAAYIGQALRNRALDVGQSAWIRRRDGQPLVDVPARAPDPERAAIERQELERVRAEIATWPSEDQLLFHLKLVGTSATGIAAALRRLFDETVDPATVDTRYFRLRARLRRSLRHEGRP
jgi:DNA-directed RNA polymerase specialized sigma24 family protein